MNEEKQKELRKNKKRIIYKIFLAFGLSSLYAMSFWLFFVCMLAFYNGGYIVITVDDYNESLWEMVLMFIGLLCGGVSIFLLLRKQ